MKLVRRIAVLGGLLATAGAQQPGTDVEEEPPPMAIQHCRRDAGCATEQCAVTLDANWRWAHENGTDVNCWDGSWNQRLCQDALTCASRCVVEGVDSKLYSKTYGIEAVADGIQLQFVSETGNVGSRVYLLDVDKKSYKIFKLKNREFAFDVDVSTLACGMNGALYLVEMDALGGQGMGNNAAGAKFGTGYCDAQCPRDVRWMNGEANLHGRKGMCCIELDIWEANRRASAYCTHPCKIQGAYRCDQNSCKGLCDKGGCDFNAYRMGNRHFYGLGANFSVDTRKPMTVVTQFLTADGTDEADLVEIRRFYVQDGRVVTQANSTISGVVGDSITDAYCKAQKNVFRDADEHAGLGGLRAMGEALDRGVVLAMSLWDDPASHMRWLDSTYPKDANLRGRPGVVRGPCSGDSSSPEHLRKEHADAVVKYTNVRYGEIGSTT